MTGVVKRAAVTVMATSALLLAGGTAAMANEAAFFGDCLQEQFASAHPDGADAGSLKHCVVSGAISK